MNVMHVIASRTGVAPRRWRPRPLAVVVLPVLVACATGEPPLGGRLATSAWARPADSGATGGAYVTVLNADSVSVDLLGATSPVARATEVHETMQHDGMAHMMARPSVRIAPRDSLVMKPGGLHLMLVGLTRRLRAGDTIPVTLRFSTGDTLPVRVPVEDR